jgi:hypothetical protein
VSKQNATHAWAHRAKMLMNFENELRTRGARNDFFVVSAMNGTMMLPFSADRSAQRLNAAAIGNIYVPDRG